ncbi:sensor histidine kinase [Pontibacter liquoris]|uniref:sensor histidine kinase n=1 Tax=Pontibacter liquoris TaxID=2905677 RepID=UPI001FA7BCAC|nr:ATP-binding protein [Pontibacter liquoris]
MVYNAFRLKLLLRLFVLIGAIVLLLLVLYRTDWYVTAFCLGLLVVFEVYELMHFVERTNRDLSSFLEAIRHSDFTQRFAASKANTTYQELYNAFNDITAAFQRVKSEKQANHLYLQAIVEHVGIGLLSYDEEGEVYLVNQVTKELLHVPHLHTIRSLDRVSEELVQVLENIGNHEKALVTIQLRHEQLLLTLHATELVSQGRKLKIVSLQNIQSELEEQELQTWQKVIRVLTHEIMNSITPIISLTATVGGLLDSQVIDRQKAGEPLEEETLEDMQAGLRIIEKRSTGMLHFVKNYRRLMRLPTPELRPVKVNELLRNVRTLLAPEMETHRVQLSFYLPDENVQLLADAEQLEQVLINLVKNGMEACQHVADPCVDVVSFVDEKDKTRLHINVTDNGPGIPEDVIDKIFIPFYTTKKQGSGIGLSLSKQIMQQHGGSIRVHSKPGQPTTFSLHLKVIMNEKILNN